MSSTPTTAYCSPDVEFTFLDSPEFYSLFLHLFGCIAFPVYILGCYCILFKTPPQMKSLTWPLLNLHVWTSLLDIGFSLLATPYLLVPILGGYSLGLLELVGVDILGQLFLMTIIGGVMCVSILGIFENRFLILSSPHHPWRKIRVAWYICNYTVGPIFFSPVFIFKVLDYRRDEMRSFIIESLPCLPDHVKNAPLFSLSEWKNLCLACVALEAYSIGFQIAMLVLQIYMALRKYRTTHSKRTVELQKKFMRALVVQLALPMMIIGVPILYCFISAVTNYYNQALNNFSFTVIASHGFFSTITMLIVQRPYRSYLLSFACGKAYSKSTVELNSISVQPSTMSTKRIMSVVD